MKPLALASLAFFLLLAADSRADIFRWEDDSGTVHFTDDLSSVPASFRGKATRVIREAPRTAVPPAPAQPANGGAVSAPAPPREDPAAAAAREREELSIEVEQMRAKIAAKEKLIRVVEERQNLAMNPYRSRVVDPGDLELYKKYQDELPGDRQRLQELESRLERLR
ncbi:MAG: DUF4124 domain-containing protein [Deltaproteobacteria bacterium]|nr:DUF4124 domain-containing protein [Candidatus Deferrimicrobiaceae bacterium]